MRTAWKGVALLALLTVAGTARAQFTWTTNNGTITITGYTGPGGEVTIPSMITGLPVTSIGYRAFDLCASLTGVLIPESVSSIGGSAFNECGNLTNVDFGSGV